MERLQRERRPARLTFNKNVAAVQALLEAQNPEKLKIQGLQQQLQREVIALEPPPPSLEFPPAPSSIGSMQKSYKLPKIELKKYSGELSEWLGWWAQFQKIHDDDEIHDSDKFQYLCQATVAGSDARKFIEAYPPTTENYPIVIAALKDRFGDKTLLTQGTSMTQFSLAFGHWNPWELVQVMELHICILSLSQAFQKKY